MDNVQRDATELDGLENEGRFPFILLEKLQMRPFIVKTALTVLFVSNSFAAAFAASNGLGAEAFHGLQSQQLRVDSSRDSGRVGTTSRSYTSASRMDMNSVGQATATLGNTRIRVR
jgi:hypothetical protein